jgi:TonB-linked SusC/RagA family outer membrane protein
MLRFEIPYAPIFAEQFSVHPNLYQKNVYFNPRGVPSLEKGAGREGSNSPLTPKSLSKNRSPSKIIIRAVKLTGLLIFIAILQVSARSDAQQRIALTVKDATLQKLFSEIEKKTEYTFFYDVMILNNSKRVTLAVKDATLEEILKLALANQDLEFTITDKTVFLKRKPKGLLIESGDPVRKVKITGSVFNESGQALSGANVTIKETEKGTITNAKGEFDLEGVAVNSTIVFSFIGYAPQQVKVKDVADLKIYLKIASNDLDKAVVQAYGLTTARLNTGDIATVTAAQIERQPVANVLEALQGQVPGLVIQQTNGYASSPFQVQIRGQTSLNPNIPSEPLYIIDGVPLTVLGLTTPTGGSSENYQGGSFTQNGFYGPAGGQSPFFSINPNDIESVTVLKDADATAIYGSRGSNGVIIITTKKGKPGKSKLNMSVYSGSSVVTQRYDLLNLHQYLAMREEAFRNDGITPSAGNAYDLVVWDTTQSTDWQKKLLGGVGQTIDAQAAISGGDKLTTFRLSGGYDRRTSILNYSGAEQRASVQFNLSRKSADERFNLSFTNVYSYTQSDLISITPTLLLPPDAPGSIFDKNGNLNYSAWVPIDFDFPFQNIRQPYTAKTDFLNSQLTLQYEFVKGLNLSSSFGYSINHGSQVQYLPISSQDPYQNPKGQSDFGNNNGNRAIIEPQLEYKRPVGKGKFDALLGGSIQSVAQDGNTIVGYGYLNDALLSSISNAPGKTAYSSNGQYKYAAIFSRVNYNWEDKYIVNLSARRDGSSRFGPGNQFGNFGAVGAAWIFTEEKWLEQHLGKLSFGKLRASYGSTGNDNIGDYQYLTQWSSQGVAPYIGGVPSYVPLHLANPDFHWEINKKLEVALDFGFLHDRINVEGVWYRNRCGDQLISFPLPSITGFNSVTANSPANIQNSGWEFTFRAKILDKKDITLSLSLNGGRNYNKLISYPDLAQSPYSNSYFIGRPLNLVAVLHYTGVDPQTGLYTFQDRNKDGVINLTYPSQGGDEYYRENNILLDGGFGTELRYKGWQLNLFFTYRRNPFVPNLLQGVVPGQIGNESVQVLNRWQKPGDRAKYASFTTQFRTSDQDFAGSDGTYSDASYIRFRNVSLAYDLQGHWLRKAGMQGCKLYFRGENLFVLTKYDGIDPDISGIGSVPPAKTFTGGIAFDF